MGRWVSGSQSSSEAGSPTWRAEEGGGRGKRQDPDRLRVRRSEKHHSEGPQKTSRSILGDSSESPGPGQASGHGCETLLGVRRAGPSGQKETGEGGRVRRKGRKREQSQVMVSVHGKKLPEVVKSAEDQPKGRCGSSIGGAAENRTGWSPSNTCRRQWASPGGAAGRDDLIPSQLSD